MTRLVRLILGAALLSAAACSGGPTAPVPTHRNALTPQAAPAFDLPPDCRNGWDVQNGRAC
jgi:hypothetical protein